jgi:mycoredoxin
MTTSPMPAAPSEGSAAVTMFTTSWCGYCVRLKKLMEREGIEFAEVDIEQDEAAADLVMQANGGNRTVPTLLFADGVALTNPSIDQVKTQLGQLSEA